jgi:hypothetical protein
MVTVTVTTNKRDDGYGKEDESAREGQDFGQETATGERQSVQ